MAKSEFKVKKANNFQHSSSVLLEPDELDEIQPAQFVTRKIARFGGLARRLRSLVAVAAWLALFGLAALLLLIVDGPPRLPDRQWNLQWLLDKLTGPAAGVPLDFVKYLLVTFGWGYLGYLVLTIVLQVLVDSLVNLSALLGRGRPAGLALGLQRAAGKITGASPLRKALDSLLFTTTLLALVSSSVAGSAAGSGSSINNPDNYRPDSELFNQAPEAGLMYEQDLTTPAAANSASEELNFDEAATVQAGRASASRALPTGKVSQFKDLKASQQFARQQHYRSEIAALPATGSSLSASHTALQTVRHTVQAGESLGSLAQLYYGEAAYYSLILQANLGQPVGGGRFFDEAGVIVPGWVLSIPDVSPARLPLEQNHRQMQSKAPANPGSSGKTTAAITITFGEVLPEPEPEQEVRPAIFPGQYNGTLPTDSTQATPGSETKDAGPAVYTVKPGDTLRRIAQQWLGDERRWPEIWKLNRGRSMPDGRIAGNPDTIYPGWQLRLPFGPNQSEVHPQSQPQPPGQPQLPAASGNLNNNSSSTPAASGQPAGSGQAQGQGKGQPVPGLPLAPPSPDAGATQPFPQPKNPGTQPSTSSTAAGTLPVSGGAAPGNNSANNSSNSCAEAAGSTRLPSPSPATVASVAPATAAAVSPTASTIAGVAAPAPDPPVNRGLGPAVGSPGPTPANRQPDVTVPASATPAPLMPAATPVAGTVVSAPSTTARAGASPRPAAASATAPTSAATAAPARQFPLPVPSAAPSLTPLPTEAGTGTAVPAPVKNSEPATEAGQANLELPWQLIVAGFAGLAGLSFGLRPLAAAMRKRWNGGGSHRGRHAENQTDWPATRAPVLRSVPQLDCRPFQQRGQGVAGFATTERPLELLQYRVEQRVDADKAGLWLAELQYFFRHLAGGLLPELTPVACLEGQDCLAFTFSGHAEDIMTYLALADEEEEEVGDETLPDWHAGRPGAVGEGGGGDEDEDDEDFDDLYETDPMYYSYQDDAEGEDEEGEEQAEFDAAEYEAGDVGRAGTAYGAAPAGDGAGKTKSQFSLRDRLLRLVPGNARRPSGEDRPGEEEDEELKVGSADENPDLKLEVPYPAAARRQANLRELLEAHFECLVYIEPGGDGGLVVAFEQIRADRRFRALPHPLGPEDPGQEEKSQQAGTGAANRQIENRLNRAGYRRHAGELARLYAEEQAGEGQLVEHVPQHGPVVPEETGLPRSTAPELRREKESDTRSASGLSGVTSTGTRDLYPAYTLLTLGASEPHAGRYALLAERKHFHLVLESGSLLLVAGRDDLTSARAVLFNSILQLVCAVPPSNLQLDLLGEPAEELNAETAGHLLSEAEGDQDHLRYEQVQSEWKNQQLWLHLNELPHHRQQAGRPVRGGGGEGELAWRMGLTGLLAELESELNRRSAAAALSRARPRAADPSTASRPGGTNPSQSAPVEPTTLPTVQARAQTAAAENSGLETASAGEAGFEQFPHRLLVVADLSAALATYGQALAALIENGPRYGLFVTGVIAYEALLGEIELPQLLAEANRAAEERGESRAYRPEEMKQALKSFPNLIMFAALEDSYSRLVCGSRAANTLQGDGDMLLRPAGSGSQLVRLRGFALREEVRDECLRLLLNPTPGPADAAAVQAQSSAGEHHQASNDNTEAAEIIDAEAGAGAFEQENEAGVADDFASEPAEAVLAVQATAADIEAGPAAAAGSPPVEAGSVADRSGSPVEVILGRAGEAGPEVREAKEQAASGAARTGAEPADSSPAASDDGRSLAVTGAAANGQGNLVTEAAGVMERLYRVRQALFQSGLVAPVLDIHLLHGFDLRLTLLPARRNPHSLSAGSFFSARQTVEVYRRLLHYGLSLAALEAEELLLETILAATDLAGHPTAQLDLEMGELAKLLEPAQQRAPHLGTAPAMEREKELERKLQEPAVAARCEAAGRLLWGACYGLESQNLAARFERSALELIGYLALDRHGYSKEQIYDDFFDQTKVVGAAAAFSSRLSRARSTLDQEVRAYLDFQFQAQAVNTQGAASTSGPGGYAARSPGSGGAWAGPPYVSSGPEKYLAAATLRPDSRPDPEQPSPQVPSQAAAVRLDFFEEDYLGKIRLNPHLVRVDEWELLYLLKVAGYERQRNPQLYIEKIEQVHHWIAATVNEYGERQAAGPGGGGEEEPGSAQQGGELLGESLIKPLGSFGDKCRWELLRRKREAICDLWYETNLYLGNYYFPVNYGQSFYYYGQAHAARPSYDGPVLGLMQIANIEGDPDTVRRVFRNYRQHCAAEGLAPSTAVRGTYQNYTGEAVGGDQPPPPHSGHNKRPASRPAPKRRSA